MSVTAWLWHKNIQGLNPTCCRLNTFRYTPQLALSSLKTQSLTAVCSSKEERKHPKGYLPGLTDNVDPSAPSGNCKADRVSIFTARKAHSTNQGRTGSIQRLTQHAVLEHDWTQAGRKELTTGKDLGKKKKNNITSASLQEKNWSFFIRLCFDLFLLLLSFNLVVVTNK